MSKGRPKKGEEKSVKEPKVKKQPKSHLSTFLLTINPNQLKNDNIKKLKESYEVFYENIENFIKNKQSQEAKITKITNEASIEKGTRRHAYHLHSLLKIFHTGKIHMDLEKIREFFNKEIPLGDDKKIYIQCKYVNDPTFSIQNYFRKEQE